MKCGTFSFKTLFRKDLTRFAPFWGGYFLCLVLGLLLLGDGSETVAAGLAELPGLMALINCGYALLTSDLLFGDLYSPRMCSGFHVLPVRREGLFAVHTAAGLTFSLIPTTGMAAIAMLLIQGTAVEGAWKIPLLWLLGVNLQYLFFFGAGVLCALWAGNRLGHVLLYGMVNLGALGLGFLVDLYYTPLLFGVQTPMERFFLFCPLAGMMQEKLMVQTVSGLREMLTLGEGWAYLGICAGVGVLLLGLAVPVYRKRRLEAAGDLLAVEFLKPLFLAGMSLAAAWMVAMMASSYDPYVSSHYVLSLLGMILGWFVGEMLLQRKLRVFRLKSAAGLACLVGAAALSLVLTAADIFGISTWIPQADQVESVQLGVYVRGEVREDRQAVESAIRFQELALDAHLDPEGLPEAGVDYPVAMLHYELKDGRTVGRQYRVPADSEAGDLLRMASSSTGAVLGEEVMALDWGRQLQSVSFSSSWSSMGLPEAYHTEADLNSLKAAIAADCEAGTMAPYDSFHGEPVFSVGDASDPEGDYYWQSCWGISLEFRGYYRHVYVYSDSENTLRWMEKRGITTLLEQETLEFLGR